MDDVEITGVGVIPADCYLEPAMFASRKIIDRFGKGKHVEVSASNSRGINPFPKDWGMHAFMVDALPLLNEFKPIQTPVVDEPAHIHSADLEEDGYRSYTRAVSCEVFPPESDKARSRKDSQ